MHLRTYGDTDDHKICLSWEGTDERMGLYSILRRRRAKRRQGTKVGGVR